MARAPIDANKPADDKGCKRPMSMQMYVRWGVGIESKVLAHEDACRRCAVCCVGWS